MALVQGSESRFMVNFVQRISNPTFVQLVISAIGSLRRATVPDTADGARF